MRTEERPDAIGADTRRGHHHLRSQQPSPHRTHQHRRRRPSLAVQPRSSSRTRSSCCNCCKSPRRRRPSANTGILLGLGRPFSDVGRPLHCIVPSRPQHQTSSASGSTMSWLSTTSASAPSGDNRSCASRRRHSKALRVRQRQVTRYLGLERSPNNSALSALLANKLSFLHLPRCFFLCFSNLGSFFDPTVRSTAGLVAAEAATIPVPVLLLLVRHNLSVVQ